MDDSIAQAPSRAGRLETGGWRWAASALCALVVGLLFIVSGTWKISDPFAWAARVQQALLPANLSMLAALGVGVAETVAGILLIVPRFRRWGAWLAGILLVAFMIWFGVHYNALRGADCSCFPWLKRVVGPGFFIGDALMLAAAWVAARWARPSTSARAAVIIFGAMAVFAAVSFGVHAARQTGAKAPDSIQVGGKAESLAYGKVFLFFFDPQCLHCYESAKKMSGYRWKEGVRIYAVPYAIPEFANGFLTDTGFKQAKVANDFETLKKSFDIPTGPSAAALQNGRQQARITNFDGDEPAPALRKLGLVE